MPLKAVLIGCNYPGSSAELKGCVNDVYSIKDVLTTYYGFQPADITVMVDTDQTTTQPTGRNIKAALRSLVAAAQDGDVLFVHYSGHGTQVPSADPNEADGKDEAICPCDMNVMTDNDLRDIFMPLKDKGTVKLTFVADCCHSGTLLDHPTVIITGPKAGGPPPPNVDVQALQSMLASLGGGKKEMDGELLKNRALPYSDLCNMLFGLAGSLLGGGADGKRAGPLGQADFHKISAEHCCTLRFLPLAVTTMFGADASASSQRNMQLIQLLSVGANMLGLTGQAGGKPAGAGAEAAGGNMLVSLLGMCFGGGQAAAEPGAEPPSTAAGGQVAQSSPAPAAHQNTGAAPSTTELPSDIGILITGCQDKETSADARPPGKPACGALTNALVTVVKSHHDSGAAHPLTYRNLVIGVRDALAKTGFAQNPCLECGGKWADSAFILP